MAVSVFLRAMKTQRTALLLIEANNNLVLTIEEMSREIRQGTNFNGPVNFLGNYIEFLDTMTGEQIKYEMKNGAIHKTVDGYSQQLTSSSIEITSFKAKVIQDPNFPSRILINITASPNSDILRNYITSIQTTVSSRII